MTELVYTKYLATYQQLLDLLLEQRSDITKEHVEQLVQEKKQKVGAGYLTDQGAIFLIAADLGVTINEPAKTDMKLKDLYAGAKEVSVVVKVLNLSSSKQFSRKDGSAFLLRTMTVYDDKESIMTVKLWDEKANLPGVDNLIPGDLVQISKAYVKSDINGALILNIGSGSTIEPIKNDDSSEISTTEIPSIEYITKDVSQVKENDNNIVVSGTLDGMISSMKFTNSRGQPSGALKLSLRGNDEKVLRVVLWGKDESDIPKIISSQAKIKLLGVRTKQGNQGALEIHGSDATMIIVDDDSSLTAAEPIIARIISSTMGRTEQDYLIIGMDKNKNFINITDSISGSNQFVRGDIIECVPSKAYGDSIWLNDDKSFIKKLDGERPEIPTVEDSRTKIVDAKSGKNVCIESIILQKPDSRDIQTKNGETISLSSMLVEDDSGQIWVRGWRNQARLIDKCSVGEVVFITGLNVKMGYEGKIEATLSAFSTVESKV